MSGVWPARPKVYVLDDGASAERTRVVAQKPAMSTRSWLGVCAAVGLACGLLGWVFRGDGRDQQAAQTPAVAGSATGLRTLSPDATNFPFGSAGAAAQSADVPALPFAVVHAWTEHGQLVVMLERDGRRFVVRGSGVHDDYLVQIERGQVVFTYLPSAVRRSLSLPPGG